MKSELEQVMRSKSAVIRLYGDLAVMSIDKGRTLEEVEEKHLPTFQVALKYLIERQITLEDRITEMEEA